MRASMLAMLALTFIGFPASVAAAETDCKRGNDGDCAARKDVPPAARPHFSYDGEPRIFRRRHRRECPPDFVWDAKLGRCVWHYR